MSTAIIIALCILLLLAYFFDITAPHTKIPSVILLLFLGWLVSQASSAFNIAVPDLQPLLPILGSIGLILIVLEGALELELNRDKKRLIIRSVCSAGFSILVLGFAMAWLLHYFSGHPLRICLINAAPLAVISSSVAISAGRNLDGANREFVTYESSLSDIFGVLIFNFLTLNETMSAATVGDFGIKMLLVLFVSFAATLVLAFLLNRINHHIKFAPIILLVILIYEVSKVYHLPALIFILIFGIFLGNSDLFKNMRWIKKLNPQLLAVEVGKFREIVAEATFLIRALFFLLFGFLIKSEEILNTNAMILSVIVVILIFLSRALILKVLGSRLNPLLYIAPRGLITILLFLAIDPKYRLEIVNESLIIQVILLTSLLMMAGMMGSGKTEAVLAERHEAENVNPG